LLAIRVKVLMAGQRRSNRLGHAPER
jgi:hypothetical protein